MKTILNCLTTFCRVSGQRINLQKSSFAVSTGVDAAEVNRITAVSRMPLTTNLETYLGASAITGRVNTDLYQKLLVKLDDRLEGWKSRFLTLAGRITMAKAVLSTSPIYCMQSALLHASLCANLDRRIRNFFWGALRIKGEYILLDGML